MEEQRCRQCDKVIHGRSDKKFCTDLCRNAHNNKKNAVPSAYSRKIVNILLRNRKVLSELSDGQTFPLSVPLPDLQLRGFRSDYHTGRSQMKRHETLRCFEFEYRLYKNKKVVIIGFSADYAKTK